MLKAATVALAFAVLLGGCASASNAPDSASSATAVPGAAPRLGQTSQGSISITDTSIQRTGQKLRITSQIHNAAPSADELVSVGSQVSPTVTLHPTLQLPANGDLRIGDAVNVVLAQQARLEPGGTVDLTFQFERAGTIQVFSSFH
jgi:copper(I)-binding protein